MKFRYIVEFEVDHDCLIKNVDKYLKSDRNMIYEFLYKNNIRNVNDFNIRSFVGGLEI